MSAAWFPKWIDPELIPAIRSLGKQVKIERQQQIVDHPLKTPHVLAITCPKPTTLNERRVLQRYEMFSVCMLGKLLADGPKLFKIPHELIDDLNQVEIPLLVDDYSQPFPAVIVQSGSEYHYVYHEKNVGLVCATMQPDGYVDWFSLSDPALEIESKISEHKSLWHVNHGNAEAIFQVDGSCIESHRFRATLNFLLLVTAGGFAKQKLSKGNKQKNRNDKSRYAIPDTFVPQDIDLWRTRLKNANHPHDHTEGTGTKKRPHWRRAHWRRVVVGVGRTGRRLSLIPARLINKKFLNQAADPAESEYMVS